MHLSLVRMADTCCKLSWKITHAYGALPNKAFHYIGNMAPAYRQKVGVRMTVLAVLHLYVRYAWTVPLQFRKARNNSTDRLVSLFS